MDWLVIEGVKPYDGRYEFDLAGNELTTREWGWLKRLAGYLPLTMEDGVNGADPELFAAFAVIALRRAGKITNDDTRTVFDRIADAPFGSTIRLENDTADLEEQGADDDSPPPASSDVSTNSSGTDTQTSSAGSTGHQNGSGNHESAGSESPQTAWAN